MLIKEAKKITESLTRTSKMPGKSYSLPAWECQTGWKLSKIEGTPCFSCYAKRNNYTRYPKIKEVQYKRLEAINHPLWVEAMAKQINEDYFRWHDAGDIQSVEHLKKIFEVCKLTPNTKHWLPTQERQYILAVDPKEIPDNLIIRLSGSKINGSVPKAWEYTSTVVTDNNPSCKAYLTDKNKKVHTTNEFDNYTKEQKKELDFGHCGDCRMCWNKEIKNVSYGKH